MLFDLKTQLDHLMEYESEVIKKLVYLDFNEQYFFTSDSSKTRIISTEKGKEMQSINLENWKFRNIDIFISNETCLLYFDGEPERPAFAIKKGHDFAGNCPFKGSGDKDSIFKEQIESAQKTCTERKDDAEIFTIASIIGALESLGSNIDHLELNYSRLIGDKDNDGAQIFPIHDQINQIMPLVILELAKADRNSEKGKLLIQLKEVLKALHDDLTNVEFVLDKDFIDAEKATDSKNDNFLARHDILDEYWKIEAEERKKAISNNKLSDNSTTSEKTHRSINLRLKQKSL